MIKFLILFLMSAASANVLAADAIPVTRINVTNEAEDKVVEVITTDSIDRLAVDALITGVEITATSVITANVLRQDEIDVTVKVETDLPNSTYTVPAGKVFGLTMFGGSYDTQSPMYIRFKKQTAGTGPWETLFRVTLKQHGQDESNHQITLSHAIIVGAAGDVFKITYDSALSKGSLWAGFTGAEY